MAERIGRTIRQMRSAEDAAISIREALVEAADLHETGGMVFGEHHLSVAVYCPSREALRWTASARCARPARRRAWSSCARAWRRAPPGTRRCPATSRTARAARRSPRRTSPTSPRFTASVEGRPPDRLPLGRDAHRAARGARRGLPGEPARGGVREGRAHGGPHPRPRPHGDGQDAHGGLPRGPGAARGGARDRLRQGPRHGDGAARHGRALRHHPGGASDGADAARHRDRPSRTRVALRLAGQPSRARLAAGARTRPGRWPARWSRTRPSSPSCGASSTSCPSSRPSTTGATSRGGIGEWGPRRALRLGVRRAGGGPGGRPGPLRRGPGCSCDRPHGDGERPRRARRRHHGLRHDGGARPPGRAHRGAGLPLPPRRAAAGGPPAHARHPRRGLAAPQRPLLRAPPRGLARHAAAR